MNLVTYEAAARHFNVSVLAICKVIQDNKIKKHKRGMYVCINLDKLISINEKSRIRPIIEILEEMEQERK